MTRYRLVKTGEGEESTAPVCHERRADARTGIAASANDSIPNERRAALAGSPSIVEPRPGEPDPKARKLTRNKNPIGNESRSTRFAPAVDDNETLDHLLSVVTDKDRLGRFSGRRKCQKKRCLRQAKCRDSRQNEGLWIYCRKDGRKICIINRQSCSSRIILACAVVQLAGNSAKAAPVAEICGPNHRKRLVGMSLASPLLRTGRSVGTRSRVHSTGLVRGTCP